MKKLLFTILGLSFLSLNAQILNPSKQLEENSKHQFKENLLFEKKANSNKRASASGWFDPAQAASDFNAFPLTFNGAGNLNLNPIWPDSSILFEYSDGFSGPMTYGAGMIFDPRNEIYANNPYQTNRWTSYTIDSIELIHTYFRNNHDSSVIDKLNFYSFRRQDVLHYIAQPFGTVYYDRTRNIPQGSSVKKLHTTLLGVNDSTNPGRTGSLSFPCNETVLGSNTGSNYFGIYFNYEPGTTYSKTEPFDSVSFQKTNFKGNHNRFSYVTASDPSGIYPSDTSGTFKQSYGNRIYNNGVFVVDFVRYTTTAQTPLYGTTWTRSGTTIVRYPWFRFHVSTQNLSIKNSNKNINVISTYPNPASKNSEVIVNLNSDVNTKAIVTILDISGKEVSRQNVDIVNGSNDIKIHTQNLNLGLYIVNIIGSEFKSVSKLLIE